MTTLMFGALALLGAWLVQPTLQVDHAPVVTGTPPAADATDDQSPQKPTTNKGGRTMR
jgi:hypothetical protein